MKWILNRSTQNQRETSMNGIKSIMSVSTANLEGSIGAPQLNVSSKKHMPFVQISRSILNVLFFKVGVSPYKMPKWRKNTECRRFAIVCISSRNDSDSSHADAKNLTADFRGVSQRSISKRTDHPVVFASESSKEVFGIDNKLCHQNSTVSVSNVDYLWFIGDIDIIDNMDCLKWRDSDCCI